MSARACTKYTCIHTRCKKGGDVSPNWWLRCKTLTSFLDLAMLSGCAQSCLAPDLSGLWSKVREQGTRSRCRKIHLQSWYVHLACAVPAPLLPPPGVGALLPLGCWDTLESQWTQRHRIPVCSPSAGSLRPEKRNLLLPMLGKGIRAPGSVAELEKHPPKVLFAKPGK